MSMKFLSKLMVKLVSCVVSLNLNKRLESKIRVKACLVKGTVTCCHVQSWSGVLHFCIECLVWRLMLSVVVF
jgi:hypothetical protein